ncbi:hypothetical protein J6590_013216 [Homalodisca vitripennis]|nr:hypothetical protein J6590_013216 [Homalodisca vitripennis]
MNRQRRGAAAYSCKQLVRTGGCDTEMPDARFLESQCLEPFLADIVIVNVHRGMWTHHIPESGSVVLWRRISGVPVVPILSFGNFATICGRTKDDQDHACTKKSPSNDGDHMLYDGPRQIRIEENALTRSIREVVFTDKWTTGNKYYEVYEKIETKFYDPKGTKRPQKEQLDSKKWSNRTRR